MKIFNRLGKANVFMLLLCLCIIVIAEYLFLAGHKLHAIFMGLWVPTILGFMIYLKLHDNERN